MSTATLANDEAIHSREFSRSPSKGSPRRALGVLSPNVRITAPNSPIVVDGKPTTTPHGSPLKVQLTVTPADILSAKDIYGYSPYLNVRKRSFAQIDNADGEEPSVEKPTSIMRLMTPNGGRVRRATSVSKHLSINVQCIADASFRSSVTRHLILNPTMRMTKIPLYTNTKFSQVPLMPPK